MRYNEIIKGNSAPVNLTSEAIEYQATDPLEVNGWSRDTIGKKRSNGKIKDIEGFKLYTRKRNLNGVFFKKAPETKDENMHKYWDRNTGSNVTMGVQEFDLTPSRLVTNSNNEICSFSSFSDYDSLIAIRKRKPCLSIGYNVNYYTKNNNLCIINWEFTVIDNEYLFEFVFIKTGNKNLKLIDALSCILDHMHFDILPIERRRILRYEYCTGWINSKPIICTTNELSEAKNNSKCFYQNDIDEFTHTLIPKTKYNFTYSINHPMSQYKTYYDYSDISCLDIFIVCHKSKISLPCLCYDSDEFYRSLSNVNGCYISMNNIRYNVKSYKNYNHSSIYPIRLMTSDVLCHADSPKKSLNELCTAINYHSAFTDDDYNMCSYDFIYKNPTAFLEYSSNKSTIPLLYASSLYGYNNAIPATITSATSSVMKNTMMSYLKCSTTAEFDEKYRGLQKINHGKVKIDDKSGFINSTSLEPISNKVKIIHDYCSESYRGGYNTCTEVGYFPFVTYDYDLKNAYATVMLLVSDVNWINPIKQEVSERNLSLNDFYDDDKINPLKLFTGYVRFKFPDNVKYPCIPVCVDGVPIYPRSSEGLDGVYVAGPAIWLALQLGATVYCDRGFFLNELIDDNNLNSHSLGCAAKQLIVDRNKAKKEKGKGSIEELILKMMVNSGYGKVAQNVRQKSTWSSYDNSMISLERSSITNPVSAMMITSIVQVILIAAQNQLYENNYSSYSVTTDGLICNCPEDIFKTFDLYGLKSYMERVRLFLTENENPEIWEIKHVQDDLVNFTTRGNVSLYTGNSDISNDLDGNSMILNGKSYAGVCAHNSAKSGYKNDSYKDRLWLMTSVLSRTKPVDCKEVEWTKFKDIVNGKTLMSKTSEVHIRMDFDMKRKPIKSSFKTDVLNIEGVEYKIAHFDTEPFENVDEFKEYRENKNRVKVLRTESDWKLFYNKLNKSGCSAKPRDYEWSVLFSCIMGYRLDLWDIPRLSTGSVKEKCAWINSHNTSNKIFKESDWKNARRADRKSAMLPEELIRDKLNELIQNI